ncbi:MAG: hypothetical protein KC729_16475, partial [Candidatus Eisenbacteria bacterium]|nr:hypothetical protein [Candidatus Eisenbacteria bacterium]
SIAGTPGAPVFTSEETNEIPSIIGRFGWVPRAGLRMGVSGSVGPYLPAGVAGAGDPIGGTVPEGAPPRAIPDGHRVEDYLQGLVGMDLEAGRGHWTLWAEAVHNRFESPWIRSDLTQNAFYVEIQRLLLPGVEAAVRWDQIRPGKIRNSSGAEVRWDLPVQRIEIGTAYHLSREFQIKVNLQMTGYGLDASSIGDEVLPSMQLVGRF